MSRFFNIRKIVFALPLLAALVYIGFNEGLRFSSRDSAYLSLYFDAVIRDLMLGVFAAALSFGLYKYDRIKTSGTWQDEAILRLEGEIGWLRCILDGLPLGVIVFDKSGKTVYTNDGFGRITGYGGEFDGQAYNAVEEKIIPVSGRKNLHLANVLKTGLPSGEHRHSIISKEGSIVPVLVNILPLKKLEGSSSGAICLFSDFTSQLELRNLRQKTHFFLDSTTSCVLAVDKNLKVTMFNTAAEKLIGLKKEDVLDRHITEIFNDYEVENYPVIKTIINGEEFHNYDITLYLNGQIRTLLFDTAVITDESGEISGAIGVFKDISERKRIEEELKRTVFAYSKEKSFMRNVLNNLPEAIITYDFDLLPTYMNSMAEELTGYRSEELTGAACISKIQTNGLPGHFSRHMAKQVLEEGEPILGEQRTLMTREGTAIPVSLDVHPLYNIIKDKNGVMVIIRDLREKREHEQLMYLSRRILSSLNSAVVSIDADYRIIVLNPPAESLLGIQAEDVIGKRIQDIPCRLTDGDRFLAETLESGRGVKFFETSTQTGSEEVMLLVNSDVVRDRENNIIGAVAIFQDITELRRTQKAVREREKLAIIGQMAAGMAHEIKNPLTAVRGFAQLLKEKCPDNPTLVEYVQIILAEVDRANAVIVDFLQLSRPKQPILKSQSVNGLLEEIIAIVGPQSFLKKIALAYEMADDLPYCRMDQDQIKQVLLNICQNAIEAMPGGGVLKIKAGHLPAQKEIYIAISDTGCGISQEKLENIGVPFFTTKATGTGLGLSISYSIIRAHNGRVEMESKEGEGTTFKIYLPCPPLDDSVQ